MRILLAFDKFKGALTAGEACDRAAAALRAAGRGDVVECAPLTDGGEGFCPILTEAAGGRIDEAAVSDPLGRPVRAPIGWVRAECLPSPARDRLGVGARARIAVVEMASASGLPLLGPEERNPWNTGTQGTGQLLRLAAREGAEAILLGIGGSATNDAGCGALEALGVRFVDDRGDVVSPAVPRAFGRIEEVDWPEDPLLPPLIVASDVASPLLGPSGATALFGPQKGLREVGEMEAALERMARLLGSSAGGAPDPAAPGMGAAGGIAYGLSCAAPLRIVPGFALVADWLGLEEKLGACDWVLTGEGKLDRGSLTGKGPVALLRLAKRFGPRLAVFAGALDPAAAGELEAELGGCRFARLSDPGWALSEALGRAGDRLAEEVSLWRGGMR